MPAHKEITQETLKELRTEITRFGMVYKFVLDEIST